MEPVSFDNLPVVALVGRPNVGKSTLFNRLLHRRRAITDPMPGVTRDPIQAEAVIAGKPFILVDTGGFKLDRERHDGDARGGVKAARGRKSAGRETDAGSRDALDDLVLEKTLATLRSADLVVLLFEAGELTNEDEEFISFLRPWQNRLIVAVNKTEGGRRESDAWNLLAYGFPEVLMISAAHGDNIALLEDAIVSRLDFSRIRPRGGTVIKIALLGKPNTGKSTLANRLTGTDGSIVSDTPGTTRDVVEGAFRYRDTEFRVLDTAGIRRKSKVTENVEYYSVNRAIKSIDGADIVFLLIDAAEGLSEQDKKIAALVTERGRGIIFALNKWDVMPAVKNTFAAVSDRIRFLFGQLEFAPIVAISAQDGTGIEELLNTAKRIYAQLNRRVDTAALNQALQNWVEEHPPPVGPGTRFKVRYAIQSSVNPVTFVVFVSRLKAVTESWIAWLRNRMRRELGFSLIPLDVELRSTRKTSRGKP
ncbi:MAG: ribosome biogenesis GTPase Der [Spirochaetaceae bacterium]|jgi:GTP-binding protein|nr:ribosome biogenesis GTPase Der [Spirochaetaceae bacterium]